MQNDVKRKNMYFVLKICDVYPFGPVLPVIYYFGHLKNISKMIITFFFIKILKYEGYQFFAVGFIFRTAHFYRFNSEARGGRVDRG